MIFKLQKKDLSTFKKLKIDFLIKLVLNKIKLLKGNI